MRRRWRPAVPPEVRGLLIARSGGWCEARLPMCAGGATDSHHRISQKSGGRHGTARDRHNRLSNLLDLCRPCHAWVTGNPTAAGVYGLALKEGDEPTECPVAYRNAVRYLADDGRVLAGAP
jgi:hypothetical protein